MGPQGDVESMRGRDLCARAFFGKAHVFVKRKGDPHVKYAQFGFASLEAHADRGKAQVREKVFPGFFLHLSACAIQFSRHALDDVLFLRKQGEQGIFFDILESLQEIFGKRCGVETDAELATLWDVAIHHCGGWGRLIHLIRNQERKKHHQDGW